jgi:thiol-disulfide isomerase/thioredoxin
VALVVTVLTGLVVALVLSFVLEDDGSEEASPDLTLAPPDDTAPQIDIAGNEVPDFVIDPLDGGDSIDFDEFRDGRPAVINFFGSWCAPCIQEMPDFQAAHREHGDEVAFLGLSNQDTVEDSLDIIEETGVTYVTGYDDGDILAGFEATYMPTTVFVKADGTILRSHTGRVRAPQLEEALAELTA